MSETKQPPQGAAPIPAGQSDKAGGTEMVEVGCKLPNGIILEMGKLGDDNYTQVRLNGSNSARVIGGYGLTPVSKAFWDAWYKKNKGLEFVRKGFVFAHTDAASAADHAAEHAEVRNGMERLDPMKGAGVVQPDLEHLKQGRQDMTQLARAG